MFRVRTTTGIDDFVGVPGDPDDYADAVAALWKSGESKPQWCFLLEEDGLPIGRIGFRVTPTTSDPRWLGSLPPTELGVFGLHLPWEGEYVAAGRRLLSGSLEAAGAELPDVLEVRINPEVHPHPEARRRLMEASGLELFQEKQGFWWEDDGSEVRVPARLEFRTVNDVGLEAYRAVMAPCGAGTLDRNDRYYWQGCGPENWAAQMTEYLSDEDAAMWLIGYAEGSPAGYVTVVSVPDWGATIGHIGVLPDRRGRGYVHDLMAAGTAAAQRSGIKTMLSDVDVVNKPMIEAMRRAGHHDGRRPWHVWAYRGDTGRIGT